MMEYTAFKEVLVIGYGTIAGEVLEYVWKAQETYGYKTSYIEHELYPFNQALAFSEKHALMYQTITDKKELTEELLHRTEKTLIISANNNFLFPSDLLDKPNITVINFHNALLPKFPGRNAASWAIFEAEKETGITWHYVTADVDAGNIIMQKRCAITEDVKAYELAKKLMELAFEGFQECFAAVLQETVQTIPQCVCQERRIYKSYETPGNAHFFDTDSPAYIYRLLRATDYGKSDIFPDITASCDDREIKVLRYKKVAKEAVTEKPETLSIPLDKDSVLQIRYYTIRGGGYITSLQQFYRYVAKMKEANRRRLSNYYLSESVLADAIKRKEITYFNKDGEYLNLYWEKEDFHKLFYFIAKPQNYKMEENADVCVCDVICRESDTLLVRQFLGNAGMREYMVYAEWVCRAPALQELQNKEEWRIVDNDDGNLFVEPLYQYFDKLSDLLPDKNELEDFIRDKHFIGIHDTQNTLIGGMVYTRQAGVITEEYVFVVTGYRGKGLSKLLHNTLYQKYYGEKVKYVAWVQIENFASIRLHTNYHYVKQELLKITFINGKDESEHGRKSTGNFGGNR